MAKSKPQGRVEVGGQAPDFTLPTQSGEMVSLRDFLEKNWVVLYFYPKDYTLGCTKEACSFRDHYKILQEAGAEVIGISSDSVESHGNFARDYNLHFTLLSDEGGKVRSLYGVPTTLGLVPGRVTYIIDKEGIVQHIFNSQYNPQAHVQEALRILNLHR